MITAELKLNTASLTLFRVIQMK